MRHSPRRRRHRSNCHRLNGRRWSRRCRLSRQLHLDERSGHFINGALTPACVPSAAALAPVIDLRRVIVRPPSSVSSFSLASAYETRFDAWRASCERPDIVSGCCQELARVRGGREREEQPGRNPGEKKQSRPGVLTFDSQRARSSVRSGLAVTIAVIQSDQLSEHVLHAAESWPVVLPSLSPQEL